MFESAVPSRLRSGFAFPGVRLKDKRCWRECRQVLAAHLGVFVCGDVAKCGAVGVFVQL